jgi:hypothetical protein
MTATIETSPPKVYAAIAAVMGDLAKAGISKGRKNVQQGYPFRGIDDVYNALSPFLATRGLVIIPAFANRSQVERVTAKGGALFYVTVEGTFTLVCIEDGSQTVAGPFFGEAMDSGDKATNKAMSAAFKYMAMEVFCIPTEGDNDADSTTHDVTPSSAAADKIINANKERPSHATQIMVDALAAMDIEEQNRMRDIAVLVTDAFGESDGVSARSVLVGFDLDHEQQLAVGSLLAPKVRNAIKAARTSSELATQP